MKTARVDGTTVTIGDYVNFKSDIEQGGTIIGINRNVMGGTNLVLEDNDGFSGDYIGGNTTTEQHASDCWID